MNEYEGLLTVPVLFTNHPSFSRQARREPPADAPQWRGIPDGRLSGQIPPSLLPKGTIDYTTVQLSTIVVVDVITIQIQQKCMGLYLGESLEVSAILPGRLVERSCCVCGGLSTTAPQCLLLFLCYGRLLEYPGATIRAPPPPTLACCRRSLAPSSVSIPDGAVSSAGYVVRRHPIYPLAHRARGGGGEAGCTGPYPIRYGVIARSALSAFFTALLRCHY